MIITKLLSNRSSPRITILDTGYWILDVIEQISRLEICYRLTISGVSWPQLFESQPSTPVHLCLSISSIHTDYALIITDTYKKSSSRHVGAHNL